MKFNLVGISEQGAFPISQLMIVVGPGASEHERHACGC
jgi:hypothetical protein